MTQAYADLVEVVGDVRHRWHRRRLLEGALLTLAAALAALVVAALADQAFDGGRASRAILALAVWAIALAALWRWCVQPIMRRHNDDYFAAMIEQQCPSLGNRLINALQLGREPAAASSRIVEAIVSDGAAAAMDADTSGVTRGPALRRHAGALGAVMLVAAAHVLIAQDAARASYARVLMPWAAIAPFTWTTIELSPAEESRILEGSPLAIEARIGGRDADDVVLRYRDDAGASHMTPMRRAAERTWRHEFPAVAAGMVFHVTAGDGRSPAGRVLVDPRPVVAGVSATLRYPAYTAMPERTLAGGDFQGHLRAVAGTQAQVTANVSKDLLSLTVRFDDGRKLQARSAGSARTWTFPVTIDVSTGYRFVMHDVQGYVVEDPSRLSITAERDMPPTVAIIHPGRDMQVAPDEKVRIHVAARDDFGLATVELLGIVNPRDRETAARITTIQQWLPQPGEDRQSAVGIEKLPSELGLQPGDRLVYWARAVDRNVQTATADSPGSLGAIAESRRFSLVVLTPQQATVLIDQQLQAYERAVRELLRLQQLNRAQTVALDAAQDLIVRQSQIRRQTLAVADLMHRNAFPARTIMDELNGLASGQMPRVITGLETYRDATDLSTRKRLADDTLPAQDEIIAALESILKRLSRNEHVRRVLKRMETQDPVAKEEITTALRGLGEKLDEFLADQRKLQEQYEKLPKKSDDDANVENLDSLPDVEHRLDRWKLWAKDTVDAITKLPQGFAEDSQLAETVSTIFEEIEKKPRLPTREIATPVEEGAKWIGTEILEDLEIWMPDRGDSIKWVMEDPPEGVFEVPEATLPDNLQDMVGDLIEDVEEFDEAADDVTGSWGGNMPQAGWDTMDGPISSFSATGKTGNQLPNASELTGRSGAGRRGRSSGQMVGSEYNALEGRPTPARVTAERYDEGKIDAAKQLDPRGATGGGKKTGAGQRGLQGSTPPDFVKDMDRLTEQYRMLREKAERIVNEQLGVGQPATRLHRAIDLLDDAQRSMADYRYDDAAQKRRNAISELRAEQSQIDRTISLSLQRARQLPPELRQQISAGSRQTLPEGYEQMVGEYYKAISEAGAEGN